MRTGPLILAALLLAATAAAQVPPLPPPPGTPGPATVDVRVQDAQLTVSLDQSGTTDVFVTNTAQGTGSPLDQARRVTLDVTGAPEGWTAAVSPTSFQLGPGQSGKAVLTVAVTAKALQTVAHLNVTARLYPLGVDAIPTAGPAVDPESRDSAGVTATREDSLTRNITERVGPYILLLLGALLLAAIAIGILLVLRGRAAVRLSCDDGELVTRPGGKVSFPLTVTNISGRDDGVALRATAPPGWTTEFSKSQFELPANSEAQLTLTVKVPKDAKPGDHNEVAVVVVSALPRKSSGIRLSVKVTE